MKRPGRILAVDNKEHWRQLLVDSLSEAGFEASAAASDEELMTRLDESFYHILVLDIRMKDDRRRDDTTGMDLLGKLAQYGAGDAMRVIILSAYGTMEQMRPAFRDFKVADFLDKKTFLITDFIAYITGLFERELEINLSLDIYWQRVSGPSDVVLNLSINSERVKRGTKLQQQLAVELDDLLCRLFHTAREVLVRPFSEGHSGTGTLWAQPFYQQGGAHPVVVKFGDYQAIESEYDNFVKFVQPYIGGGRNTSVLALRRTPRLGGIVYSLLGTASHTFESFGTFYERASTSEIYSALDNLFLDTCSTWYANPGQIKPQDLSEEYRKTLGFSEDKLQSALLEQSKFVQGKDRLRFLNLDADREFTNPLLIFTLPPQVRPTYSCITHGDINDQNVLIDSNNQSWLIDFQRTGPGHIFRDVAELDAIIRLQLLAPEQATLGERLQLEDALSRVQYADEQTNPYTEGGEIFPNNAALAKAYAALVHLHFVARKLVSQGRESIGDDYFIALLYYALNATRFRYLHPVQRQHALLSASLLFDRLRLQVRSR